MTCLLLFYEFFKTGLFAVGGGLATLPFLYDMAARHPEWFTVSQLADMLAVSESTPGPLGVNMATYVGYLTAGIPGAVAATMGLVTPSVIVILIVAAFLKRFRVSRTHPSALLTKASRSFGWPRNRRISCGGFFHIWRGGAHTLSVKGRDALCGEKSYCCAVARCC